MERRLPDKTQKGDLSNCNNYRGIMLLSVPGKVLSRILLNRMKKKVDPELRDQQAGFLRIDLALTKYPHYESF